MAAIKVWGMLGTDGWVTDPSSKLTKSFAHSLASDAIQSTIYTGRIMSMMEIIVKYQNNPDRMIQQLIERYQVFYSKIFDSAEVEANYELNPNGSYNINLGITVHENGIPYSLSYAGAYDKGTLYHTLQGLTQ